MKYLLLSLCLFFAFLSPAFSQLTDDFSDGNFTANPTWIGANSVDATTGFIVNGSNRLQTNIPSGGTGTRFAYLSTPIIVNLATTNYEWNFDVQLTFATPNPANSTNRAKIYLLSDQSNLSTSLNGYFIEISDKVTLQKQVGETDNFANQITTVEWYFEGELKTDLGNSFEITPTEKGNYSAKVTTQNGCIFQTRTIYFTLKTPIVTGEEEITKDTFKIYPNPNNGIFKVQFETILLENTEVTIFDGIGRKIHTQIFEKGNQEFIIDIKNQPKGMYLIHFNQNNKTFSKQIIIE